MAIFLWSDRFKINVKVLDDQHRQLIRVINELHDAMQSGRGRDVIGTTLTKLINYTMTHFSTEEEILLRNRFPMYAEHKRQHDLLTGKVVKYKKEYDAGATTTSVEILNFMIQWLTDHLLKTDHQYSAYLNQCGVK